MAKLEQWRWKSQELKPISWHFYNTCEKFPDRDAQLFNPKLYHDDHNGRLTWSQMKNRVEAIACGLMSFGLEKGHGWDYGRKQPSLDSGRYGNMLQWWC
jgi:non-ribosomal peptide synthetase component F